MKHDFSPFGKGRKRKNQAIQAVRPLKIILYVTSIKAFDTYRKFLFANSHYLC